MKEEIWKDIDLFVFIEKYAFTKMCFLVLKSLKWQIYQKKSLCIFLRKCYLRLHRTPNQKKLYEKLDPYQNMRVHLEIMGIIFNFLHSSLVSTQNRVNKKNRSALNGHFLITAILMVTESKTILQEDKDSIRNEFVIKSFPKY